MWKSFSLYWLRDRDEGNIMKHKTSLLESNKNWRFNCTLSVLLNQYMLNAWRQKDNHKHCSQLGGGQWGTVCHPCWIRWKNSSFQRWGEHRAEVKVEGLKGGGHQNASWSSFLRFLPVQSPGRKRQGGQQSHRVKLTGWKCCRGEQALLCKLPWSLPLPGSSAWCHWAPQHRPSKEERKYHEERKHFQA